MGRAGGGCTHARCLSRQHIVRCPLRRTVTGAGEPARGVCLAVTMFPVELSGYALLASVVVAWSCTRQPDLQTGNLEDQL